MSTEANRKTVETLWNGGRFDVAILLLRELERVTSVAGGIAWREPLAHGARTLHEVPPRRPWHAAMAVGAHAEEQRVGDDLRPRQIGNGDLARLDVAATGHVAVREKQVFAALLRRTPAP